MTVEEAIRKFEALFDAVQETTMYGDDVVSMGCGGVMGEGERIICLVLSETDAMRLWLQSATAYRQTCNGNLLVWRIKPDIGSFVVQTFSYINSPDGALEPMTVYKVHSRFAIRSATFIKKPAPDAPDYMGAVRETVGAR